MTGKITRANVEEYAKDKGLEPIQIDGIPEGFSFLEPTINISNSGIHGGRYIAFIPNSNWNNDNSIIKTRSLFDLIENYFNAVKIRNGK